MTHEALVKLLTNEESHYCNNVRLCMLFLKHFVLFTHGEILSISPYSVRMREKTPDLDTFHAVLYLPVNRHLMSASFNINIL